MSHHSDEHHPSASSDSFWEIGNFKRTTKRIEDGHRLCDDLMRLVQDRAEIEKLYAKQLKDWAKKWNNLIEKGPEYGTTEAAWKAVLIESEQVSDLHISVKENLMNQVHGNLKNWQKENYHKSMMGQLKEKRDSEEMFKKAQKQWSKLYERVNKARHDYHSACKGERSALIQERNANADSGLSPDQRPVPHTNVKVKKLQERVSKAKEDVQKNREKYEAALKEINEYNPKYIEEMTQVFEKAQEGEQKRLQFFKEMLFATHKCLNISEDPNLPRIYEEFQHTVSNADFEKDLKWWSNNYGVNMPMNWPSYEEYNPDQPRAKKLGKGGSSGGNSSGGTNNHDNSNGTNNHTPAGQPPNTTSPASSKASDNRHSAISNGVSGGEEDEWDYSDRVDPNKEGVAVRALYDYEGVEGDELSFKCGEEFEKLEDEDEQGWCTGRKDGRIGLYPANYVQAV